MRLSRTFIGYFNVSNRLPTKEKEEKNVTTCSRCKADAPPQANSCTIVHFVSTSTRSFSNEGSPKDMWIRIDGSRRRDSGRDTGIDKDSSTDRGSWIEAGNEKRAEG
ncbi:hypothetical protein KPH14_008624 [Odynerus spinipes]|uniref:Uncharacterized protein n=1 Tax=Odynerus spinipes TaxID=1348599 RepID=A0AAD9RTG9_9HYME|nr:hypothetical protein KPH14_008624 [Odynerus spinipes]